MKIYRHLIEIPLRDKMGAVAIGNFDGVHQGHRTVIGEAGDFAKMNKIPWVVLTFEPHPRQFFQNSSEPFRLTPFRTKASFIRDLGVDIMVVLRFDQRLCQCDAKTFIQNVLIEGLSACHVVTGYDFRFGHNREGDCSTLLNFGKKLGYGFTAVSAASDDGGGIYASTNVRKLLKEGKITNANAILGRPFSISGIVRPGKKLGRKIGFPTANMALGSYIRPRFGVYAIRAHFNSDRSLSPLMGVANIGNRPTVDGHEELLESFFFDFNGDLYGQRLSIELLKFIREEWKFTDVDSMAKQIAEDCKEGRNYFEKL